MILLITLLTLIVSGCIGTGIYPRNKSVSNQFTNTKEGSAPPNIDITN